MSENLINRLDDISSSFGALGRELSTWGDAWPTGTEFEGSDETGALTIVIDAQGDTVDIHVASDWHDRLAPREIVRALAQAKGAASAAAATKWDENREEQDAAPAAAFEHRDGAPRLPEPPSLEELSRRLGLLRQAQSEALAYRRAVSSLNDRTRFDSPSGMFSVVRSGEQLVALEPTEVDLRFTSGGTLANELLAVYAQIAQRAADDREHLRSRYPALAEIRAQRGTVGAR